MAKKSENYTFNGWIAAAALVGVLVAVSFIPPRTLGGVKIRRANILSDIFDFDDTPARSPESAVFNEEEFQVDMTEVAERIDADTLPPRVQTLSNGKSAATRRCAPKCCPTPPARGAS